MSKKNIKMIALDMDGTLLNDAGSIPQANVQALGQALAKGIKIILVSARPACAMLPYYQQLHLADMPMAALCGAYIVHHSMAIQEKAIPAVVCGKILSLFDMERDYIKAYGKNSLYVNRITDETIKYAENFNVPYKKVDFLAASPDKICRIYIPGILQKQAKLAAIQAVGMNHANLLESGIEIMPEGINKGSAVEFLCKRYGFSAENVMAAGNEGSDVSMVSAAGVGVAVGNAIASLQKIADVVVASNNEAGVAEAVQRYCL